MGRNLKHQFINAINKNFKECMDKHSAKHSDGIGTEKIYSYADRKNLLDVACNFANYMKHEHSEIRMVKDIKEEHIQGFFNEKAKECSYLTLEQYRSRFNKLEKLVKNTYHVEVNYSRGYDIPITREQTEKLRSISMSKQEYSQLSGCIEASRSAAVPGIHLSARFGLRVSEISKLQGRDIDLERNVIRIIGSKGGRDREIPIRSHERSFCEEIKREVREHERVVPLRSNSINTFLQRSLEKCGLREKYSSAKTGIHSIRKMAAQNHYDECRANGMSIREAKQDTSQWLGHGKDRLELMNEYIERQD
ncbi:tyrosine-type recombinase/integrase [Clostridium paraputrificum]|uniref:Tyr recombinase domain-containing protein n=1 Tax=Clostridium paraputrificum TaxID=29363 RepID=A0A1B8RUK0_9CLOT|nr:tyrosine-type recombinase/integrase [Clostridium paraputrificum]OBY12502.1 hypothetical protein CP373A1_00075 [Clostridium paraputrificum]